MMDTVASARSGTNRGGTVSAATSQAALAYQALLNMLLHLEIAPGSPLNESELMETIGVGRTPLREAINRLEAERLVKIYPRRGTFATEVNLTDLALITELRVGLEGLAAASAAERATTQERGALADLVAGVTGMSAEDQMALDTRIHRAVYAAAHNEYLEETARRFHNLSMRIWRLIVDRRSVPTSHLDQHQEMLLAIVDGDSDRSRSLAESHVRTFESTIHQLL